MDRVIKGYAIRFSDLSTDLGGFRERFLPGSVDYTIKHVDVRALAHHDVGRLLGRVSAKTLKLSKDREGLIFELDLPDTSDGRDVYTLVERKDLTGASFAFRLPSDGSGESWDFSGPVPLRTIHDAMIREISLVAWPAYPTTSVTTAVTGQQRGVVTAAVTGNGLAWRRRQLRNLRAR